MSACPAEAGDEGGLLTGRQRKLRSMIRDPRSPVNVESLLAHIQIENEDDVQFMSVSPEEVDEDGPLVKVRRSIKGRKPRFDGSLAHLTRKFMALVKSAPEGVLDLNEVSRILGVRKRRVYDITNVLDGILLIQKRSKNLIQWIGSDIKQITRCTPKQQKLKDELYDLSAMEAALDELIKDCAHQLFDLTDDKENAKYLFSCLQLGINKLLTWWI